MSSNAELQEQLIYYDKELVYGHFLTRIKWVKKLIKSNFIQSFKILSDAEFQVQLWYHVLRLAWGHLIQFQWV